MQGEYQTKICLMTFACAFKFFGKTTPLSSFPAKQSLRSGNMVIPSFERIARGREECIRLVRSSWTHVSAYIYMKRYIKLTFLLYVV